LNGNVRSLIIQIVGYDQTGPALRSAKSALGKFGADVARIGSTLSYRLTMPLVGVGVAAGKMAVDFDEAMRNVQSITRVSDDVMQQWSDTIRSWSKDITKSTDTATNLAQALYFISSSGFQGADALEILRVATKSATAGLTDTETAAKALITAINAYGLSAKDASHISDVMFRTVDLGILTYEELADAMGRVLGTAAMAKVPIEEIGAAAVVMTRRGLDAYEAFTSINNILKMYIHPAKQARKAAAALGIDLSAQTLINKGLSGALADLIEKVGVYKIVATHADEAIKKQVYDIDAQIIALERQKLGIAGNTKEAKAARAELNNQIKALRLNRRELLLNAKTNVDFVKVQADIAEKLGLTIEQVGDLFPNIRALRGVMALVVDDGEMYNEMVDEMQHASDGAGRTEETFAIQTKSLSAQIKVLRNIVMDAGIALGERLVPALLKLAEKITPLINAFAGLSDEAMDWVVKTGLVVAAVGPALYILGTMISTLTILKNAFGLVGLAAAGLAVIFATNIGGMRDQLLQLAAAFPSTDLGRRFAELGNTVSASMVTLGQILQTFVMENLPSFQAIFSHFGEDLEAELTGLANIFEQVVSSLPGILARVTEVLGPLIRTWSYLLETHGPMILESVQTTFGLVAEIVGAALHDLELLISLSLGNIAKFFEAHKEAITGILAAAWRIITSEIRNALVIVLGLLRALGFALQGDWGAAWATIRETATAVGDEVIKKWQDVGRMLTPAWNEISAAASQAWQEVKKAVTGQTDETQKNVKSAWDAIQWTTVAGSQAICEALPEPWARIASYPEEYSAQAKASVQESWGSIRSSIVEESSSAAAQLAEPWATIASYPTRYSEQAKACVVQTWPEIRATVETSSTAASMCVATAWQSMQQSMATSSSQMQAQNQSLWANIEKTITSEAPRLLKAAVSWLDEVLLAIEKWNPGPAINMAIGKIAVAMVDFFAKTLPDVVWPAIQYGLSQVGLAVVNFFEHTLPESIAPAVSGAFESVKKTLADSLKFSGDELRKMGFLGEQIGNAIVTYPWKSDTMETVDNIGRGIVDSADLLAIDVGNLMGFVGDVIAGAPMGEAAAGMMGGLMQDIARYVDEHQDDLKAVGIQAVEGIRAGVRIAGPIVVQIATQVGQDIVSGTAEGVRREQPSLNQQVREMAQQGIRAARGELRAQSPSQAFAEIGVDIILGLIQGIEEKKAEAFSSAARAAAELFEAFLRVAEAASLDLEISFPRDLVEKAAQAIHDIVDIMRPHFASASEELKEQADNFGSAAKIALDLVASAIEAFIKLPEVAGIGDVRDYAERLGNLIYDFLKAIISWAEKVTPVERELARVFAEKAKAVLEIVQSAIEAMVALPRVTLAPRDVTAFTGRLAEFLKLLITELARLYDELGRQAVARAKALGEGAKEAVGLVSDAVEAMVRLPEVARLPDLGPYLARVAEFLGSLVTALGEWAERTGRAAQLKAEAFAASAKGVIEIIEGAVTAMAALPRLADIPHGLGDYINRLDRFLMTLVANLAVWASQVVPEALEQARSFVEVTKPVLEAVTQAVELMAQLPRLADVPRGLGAYIERLNRFLYTLVAGLATWAAHLSVEALALAKSFAESAQPVVELVENAINAMAALPRLADIPRGLGDYINRLNRFLATLVSNLAVWARLTDTEARQRAKDFAESAKPVVELVSSAIDAMAALPRLALIPRGLGDYINRLSRFLITLVGNLAAWVRMVQSDARQRAKEFAEATQPVIELVSSAIDAMAALPRLALIPRGLGDYINRLSRFLITLVGNLAAWARMVQTDARQRAKEFAEAAQPVVELVQSAIEAMAALPRLALIPRGLGDYIDRLSRFLVTLVANLAAWARTVNEEARRNAQDFATAAKDVVEVVKDTIGVMADLPRIAMAPANLPDYVNRVSLFLTMLVKSLATWARWVNEEARQNARAFAEAAKPVVEVISTALEAVAALPRMARVPAELSDYINRVSFFLVALVKSLATWANWVDEQARQNARTFAEAAQPVVEMVSAALDVIAGLAKMVMPADLPERVGQIADFLAILGQAIGQAALTLDTLVLAAAKDLAEATGPILGILSSAIDALARLRGLPWYNLEELREPAEQLAQLSAMLVTIFSEVGAQFASDLLEAVQNFASAAQDCLGLLSDAMEVIDAMVRWVAVPDLSILEAKLRQLADFAHLVVVQLGRAALAFDKELLEAVQAFAGAASDAISLLSDAMEAISAVACYVPIPDLASLRDALDQIARFAELTLVVMGRAAIIFDEELLAAIQSFAAAAQDAIDLIQPAIEALNLLGKTPLQLDFVTLGRALDQLAQFALQVLFAFQGASVLIEQEVLTAIQDFAAAAGDVLDLIESALGTLDALAKPPRIPEAAELEPLLTGLAGFCQTVVRIFSSQAEVLGEDARKALSDFADVASDVLGLVSDAIDVLGDITAGVTIPNEGQVRQLARGIRRFLDVLVSELGRVTTIISEEAAAQIDRFASAAQNCMEMVSDAVDLLPKIVSYIPIPDELRLRYVLNEVEQFARLLVEGFGQLGQELESDLLKAAQEFADSVGPAFGVLSDALEVMTDIRHYVPIPNWRAFEMVLQEIVAFLQLVAEYLGRAGERLGQEFLEAARTFAESVRPGLEALSVTADLLERLRELVPTAGPVLPKVEQLADLMVSIATILYQRAREVPGEVLAMAQSFASAIADTISNVKEAIEGIIEIAQMGGTQIGYIMPLVEAAMREVVMCFARLAHLMVVELPESADAIATVTTILLSLRWAAEALQDILAVRWDLLNLEALRNLVRAIGEVIREWADLDLQPLMTELGYNLGTAFADAFILAVNTALSGYQPPYPVPPGAPPISMAAAPAEAPVGLAGARPGTSFYAYGPIYVTGVQDPEAFINQLLRTAR